MFAVWISEWPFSTIELPFKLHLATSEQWFGQEQEGILPELFSIISIVWLSIVAQSFEQLTGFVYQIWLHLIEYTHCA